MRMKVLTLTQPYATLVAIGAKQIETRSWATSYRGPLAIHAGKGPGLLGSYKAMLDLCGTQPFFDALMPIVPNYNRYCDRESIFDLLPVGAIVAVCELVCCKLITGGRDRDGWYGVAGRDWPITDQERAFGDYSDGRYAWLLADIRALPEPIPARGAQGLWSWADDLAQLPIGNSPPPQRPAT
jgi:activating signal cointegrator 1